MRWYKAFYRFRPPEEPSSTGPERLASDVLSRFHKPSHVLR
jgi:hypothetical protein